MDEFKESVDHGLLASTEMAIHYTRHDTVSFFSYSEDDERLNKALVQAWEILKAAGWKRAGVDHA